MGGFIREMKWRDKYGREYSYWVAIKSYRDKDSGKVRNQVLQTFGKLSKEEADFTYHSNRAYFYQLEEKEKGTVSIYLES